MTTAGNLRDHIKSDLIINGTDYDTQILNAIWSALRQLRNKRYWFLEDSDTVTLLAGNSSIALPSNYAAPKNFRYVSNGVWQRDGAGFDFYMNKEDLEREYWLTDPLQTQPPRACAEFGGTLYVSDLADASYTIYLDFYQKDATLLAASETSVWFDDGYDAVRTLAQYIFKRDAQGFTATDEDGSMHASALARLNDAQEARKAGR